MPEGLIIKGIGGFYYIKNEDTVYECIAKGRFRVHGVTPMVGDRVMIELQKEGYASIKEIFKRKNSIIRPPISNVDNLFVVVSPIPAPSLINIDKVLALAESRDIDAYIVINKTDIDTDEAESSIEELSRIYEKAGYRVLKTSAILDEGTEAVRSMLNGAVSAFCGNSGVGKSSLLRRILNNTQIEVGEISEKTKRGRHTTRHVELFAVGENGYIADTPGFGMLEIEDDNFIYKDDLKYAFREFAPYIQKCKFKDCSHTKEKDCALKDAVQANEIEISRYRSYLAIYDRVKEIKEWER